MRGTNTLSDFEQASGFEGSVLYRPLQPAPAPAILLLHGSEGGWAGWSHVTAVALAHRGFVAMPLPYSFGGNWVHAGDIHDISLDRTERAVAWLRTSPLTSGKVGLYGVSRGAEHALLVTSLMARDDLVHLPDAVAVHAPSDEIVGAFMAGEWMPNDEATRDAKGNNDAAVASSRRAWSWRGSGEALSPGMQIEIERYNGPVFISHGTSDEIWSVDRTRRIEARLQGANRNPEVHYFAAEGHWLSPSAANKQKQHLVSFFERTLK